MPQIAFFPLTHNLLVSQKTMQRPPFFLSTLHPLSLVIFATATVLAFVLLHNFRFNFHCYIQDEATPTQKSSRRWRCDLSRLLAWKITKGIHLCKFASFTEPPWTQLEHFSRHWSFFKLFSTSLSLAGTATAKAALTIPISVCSIFVCPNNGMAARVWDF